MSGGKEVQQIALDEKETEEEPGSFWSNVAIEKAKDEPPSGSKAKEPLSKMEFRQLYSQLIESCNEMKNSVGLDEETQKKMNENIRKSTELISSVNNSSGIGPGEMYIACFHAKVLSDVLRHKSDRIGNSSSEFTLESFIGALKQNHIGKMGSEVGEFCSGFLTDTISKEQNAAARTVPSLHGFVGCFDRSTFAKPCVRVKKARAAPRKKLFDETQATKHIDVNVREEQRRQKDQSAMKLSMDLLKILEIYYSQNSKALGLYNFAMDKNSLASTIKYICYLGFLVREGHISIKREGVANLVVKPEKTPEKGQNMERQQFIFSINPKQYKALAQASQGEDIITAYKLAHYRPNQKSTLARQALFSEASTSTQQIAKKRKGTPAP